jgi:uncharacterized protein YdaU (DUF1376 family)
VDDYLEDEAVMLMSAEAEGCYIRLLCKSWKSKTPGVIKADLVPVMCGLYRVPEIDRERVLGELSRAFDIDNSWTQKRMVQEWSRANNIYKGRKLGARKTNDSKHVHAERALSVRLACAERPLSVRSPRVGVGVGVGESQVKESVGRSELVGNRESTPVAAAPASAPGSPPVVLIPLRGGTEFPVTLDHVKRWEVTFPGVIVTETLREMAAWAEANPERRKTRKGALRFITGWLMREQDKHDRSQNGHPNRR